MELLDVGTETDNWLNPREKLGASGFCKVTWWSMRIQVSGFPT